MKRYRLQGFVMLSAALFLTAGIGKAQVESKPIPGLTVAEQRRANEKANKFVLPIVKDAPAGEGGEVMGVTGVIRPTPEQEAADLRKNGRIVKQVRLNKIGLARLNAERRKKGLKPFVAGPDVQVAPIGRDIVTFAPGKAPAALAEEAAAAAEGETVPLAESIAAVDNSSLQYFPPIGNQGSVGSCAAWASTYYNTTYECALQRNWDAKSSSFYRCAPMWGYNFLNGGQNVGSWPTDYYNMYREHGCVRQSEQPNSGAYRFWLRDNPDAYRRALNLRTDGYLYFGSVNTESGLQVLKDHLANGHIGEYCTYVSSWKFKTTSDDPSTPDDDPYVGKSIVYMVDGTSGGHAMTVCGYNDNIWCDIDGDGVVDDGEKGALRIANSWGTGYKEAGFTWIAYAALDTGIFWSNAVRAVDPRSEPYEPKVVARITINHNLRNQVYVKVGTGSIGATSPSSFAATRIVLYDGGAYAFDGSAAASQDFSYCLDLTDIAPSVGTTKRWFVQATDSGSNDGDLTIKNFDLYYTSGGVDRLVGNAANVPQVANGITKYAWLDWTMGDAPPAATLAATDAIAAEAGNDVAIWTITRDGDTSAPLTINYTLGGTAVEGSDYTVSSASSVTIAEGQTSATVTLTPIDDSVLNEGVETVTLALAPGSGYVVGESVAAITIDDNDYVAPTVGAGLDQTVTLTEDTGGGEPVAGAYYEWDAAQDTDADGTWESTTDQSYDWTMESGFQTPVVVADPRFTVTRAYVFPAAKSLAQTTLESSVNENSSATWEFVLDTDADDGLIMESGGTTDGIQFWIAGGVLKGQVRDGGTIGTVSYTLTDEDKAGFIHAVYVIDMASDFFSLYVNGSQVDSVTWTGSDWSGSNEAGLGRVGGSAPAGGAADFTGKIALVRLYQSKAFTPGEVSANFGALLGQLATATLDGTVTTAQGSALPITTTWSAVDPQSSVGLADASAVDTTAMFFEAGEYTLRLTADDGISQISDDVVITVNDGGVPNQLPVADAGADQTVTDADDNGSESLALDAAGSSDPDGTIVSYVWTEGATQIATGSNPTVALAVGVHTITLTVTDNDGATASDTVIVTVNEAPNQLPVADAGADQTVTLSEGSGGGDPVAGAYFEWDAAQDADGDNTWASTAANAYTWTFDGGSLSPESVSDARFDRLTHAYSFPAAKDKSNSSWNGFGSAEPATWEFVIDVDGNDGSIFETGAGGDGMQVDVVGGVLRGSVEEDPTEARATYTLTAEDLGRFIHVVFVADNVNDVLQLYVDGDLKDEQPWTAGNDWSGSDGASLGSSSGKTVDGGSSADFSGKMALMRFYRDKAFTAAEVTTNFDALSAGSSAVANLDGTASDPDAGDTLTTTWSVVNGPTAVAFGDAGAVDTAATFTQAGVYTLRLTADDGQAQASDDVEITVNEGVTPNEAPVANAGADQSLTDTDGNGTESVTLDGTGSSDPDGTIASYVWEEGAAQIATGASPAVDLAVGVHTITLTVMDDESATATDTVVVTVSEAAGSSTVALVSAADRIGWFSFDADSSDADGNLSLSLRGATVGVADAKYGEGALRAAASGEYARISDNNQLNTGGPWSARTIAAWFKLDTVSGRQLVLEEGGSARGFNIYVDNGNLYVGGWDKNMDGDDVDTWAGTWLNLGTVSAGQWYHVALVLDATADPAHLSSAAFAGYLNGTAIAAGNGMQISAHSDDFGIASVVGSTVYHDGATSGNDAFAGNIDDLAIYNRALSESEVATLAEADTSAIGLACGTVDNVGSSWQTVTLPRTYNSMVVVATPVYTSGTAPMVPRIRNAAGNSFELKLQNPGDGSAVTPSSVQYVVVEEGVYNTAEHGVTMEAVKYNSTVTDAKNSWGGEVRNYANSYGTPVVVGQVMTDNDPAWSAFWCRGGSQSSSPDSTTLYTGKHVAEDSNKTRADETVGYIVLESGTATVDGLNLLAGIGSDSIAGMDNGSKDYPLSGISGVAAAVCAIPGFDGGDGGWPVLYGTPGGTALSLVVDEDQIGDSERSHTSEQVAYLVIDGESASSGTEPTKSEVECEVVMTAVSTDPPVASPVLEMPAGAAVETTIELLAGLNLVSLPIEPAETNTAALFGGAEVYSIDADGNYVAAETVVAGQGYWVKVDKGMVLDIAGTMPAEYATELVAGWNLFGLKGSYAAEGVDLDTVAGGEVLLKAGLQGWNPVEQVYEPTDVMVPGQAYSVYIEKALTIELH